MEILVQIKTIYGNETIYPVDTPAKLFAKLAGTKTLTRAALRTVKELGYEIKVQQDEIEL